MHSKVPKNVISFLAEVGHITHDTNFKFFFRILHELDFVLTYLKTAIIIRVIVSF